MAESYLNNLQSFQFQIDQEFEEGWIQWFLSLDGNLPLCFYIFQDHSFFCEMNEEFIKDHSNYYGIKGHFTNFEKAMKMILSQEPPQDEDLEDEKFLETYQEAADLYGLLHARFILTPKGMEIMKEKFLVGKFGVCPRFHCEQQQVLPLGISDDLKISRVKVFCPKCEDVYLPKKHCSDVDGAYFGTSFPHIFLKTFTELVPKPSTEAYVPKIYGFKLFKKNGSQYWEENNNNQRENYKKKIGNSEKNSAVKQKK